MPISIAANELNLPVTKTYSSEIDPIALHVAAVNFPEAVPLGDIHEVSQEVIVTIVEQFPDSLFVLGAGPPCTDVSFLKSQGA
eukprot:8699695-Karenia_brevis.AAC.1